MGRRTAGDQILDVSHSLPRTLRPGRRCTAPK
jgi:hypothetical protein